MTTLNIPTPRVFLPLLSPARHKGAHGGRGSGKSHFFAELLIERCLMQHTRAVCIREIQKSIKESVKRLLEDKIKKMDVSHLFTILEAEIRGPNDSLIIFQGMQGHTEQSIKSLEGYHVAWVEEAHCLSYSSLKLLRPTIRADGSEIWYSWNPETKKCAVEELLRGQNKVSNSIVVEANWRDNPYFPKELKEEMEEDRKGDADDFNHIWEGRYKLAVTGAVYAKEIRELYASKRIMKVLPIAGKPVETFWDLGKRDHTSIWFAQLQMGEYRILDFYQNKGFGLSHYVEVIKARGYTYGMFYLPHDADQERLNANTIADDLRTALPNHEIIVRPRMASKSMGINAVRKIFPFCYFDESKTAEGVEGLSAFKFDVDPDTGGYSQNPLHDENSDCADAFAQLALSLEESTTAKPKSYAIPSGRGSYMGV